METFLDGSRRFALKSQAAFDMPLPVARGLSF